MLQELYSRGVGGRDLECPAVRQLEPAAGQAQAPGGHGYYRYILYIHLYLYLYLYLVVTPSWPPATPRSLAWSHETAASPVSGGRVSTMSQSCHHSVIVSYCHNYRTHIAGNSLQPEPLGGHEVPGLRDAPPQHPRGCNSL